MIPNIVVNIFMILMIYEFAMLNFFKLISTAGHVIKNVRSGH